MASSFPNFFSSAKPSSLPPSLTQDFLRRASTLGGFLRSPITSSYKAMPSLLSYVNPIPSFPDYSGPYKVGTIDVEIPVADLESPAPTPEEAQGIKTIQFRIFYPTAQACANTWTNSKRVNWLPKPQRQHLLAYIKFMGLGDMAAEVASFIPRHLHWTTIPVVKNADLAPMPADDCLDSEKSTESGENSTPSDRWPVMIFSHGLGGSRNAYSHFAGSIASYGVVVVCPEHRDGSSVVSFMRDPDYDDTDVAAKQPASFSFFSRPAASAARAQLSMPYKALAHDMTPEISAERDAQLRERCWELGLLHDALLRMDAGAETGASPLRNLNASTTDKSFAQFQGRLDLHRPGSVVFAGHSFGAATVVQFLKSVFYCDHPSLQEMLGKPAARSGMPRHKPRTGAARPVYVPGTDTAITRQITADTVTVLLDMWCFPLVSPFTRPLFALPLPCYHASSAASGDALLAIESEQFFKWTEHLHTKARVLSPCPKARVVSSEHFSAPPYSPSPTSSQNLVKPHFYYVSQSAHLSQSDFGVLFPWLTRSVCGAVDPDGVLRLNARAVLELLRRRRVRVALGSSPTASFSSTHVSSPATPPQTATISPERQQVIASVAEILLAADDDASSSRDSLAAAHGIDEALLQRWRPIDVVGLGGASRAVEVPAVEA